MITAVLHVYQEVKCDILSQNARAWMDNFNALSDKDTQSIIIWTLRITFNKMLPSSVLRL